VPERCEVPLLRRARPAHGLDRLAFQRPMHPFVRAILLYKSVARARARDSWGLASFSRPGVSNDNAYSEALFRTMKYRPAFSTHPFEDLAAAQAWVAAFVRWYNTQHLHSAIRFVTPNDRHAGRDTALLAARRAVYARARRRTPARWSGTIRNWEPINAVRLNPEHDVVAVPARVA